MNNCATCVEAEKSGHLDFFHCETCHVSFAGHAECHCADCCRTFSGDSAFQAHRQNGECRDPSLLKDGNRKPRFVPVIKSSKLGTRCVWVRNVELPVGAFQAVSKRSKSDEAPAQAERVAVAS